MLMSESSLEKWSGIFLKTAYLKNELREAEDFMDPDQADYGKACQVIDYLGVIDSGDGDVLVLGDDRMSTTTVHQTKKEVVLARWGHGESEEHVHAVLSKLSAGDIKDWKEHASINIQSNRQFIFDSAMEGNLLKHKNPSIGFLKLSLAKGSYKAFTSVFEPDPSTRLVLHWIRL